MMDDRETARLMLAAAALQGMTSCMSAFVETPEDIKPWTDVIPREAVFLADATLAELAKPPSPAQAADPKNEAATPRAEEPTTKDAAAQEPAVSPVVVPAGTNPTSLLSVFSCEAAWPTDPPCPGTALFDPVTRGRFCADHMRVEESARREMHRRHGARNRPTAPVARLAG